VKRLMIMGLADTCPLCIDADARKASNKPMFVVASEGGGYSGPVCAAHLAALIKLDEPKPAVPPQQPKPAQVAPTGNGPPAAPVAK
jgi:hypothetical protein